MTEVHDPVSTSQTLTLIIHGTFARKEDWWRLGDGKRQSFADRLELSLAKRGLEGSVWAPALDRGVDYGDFSWSGDNRHKARLAGARKMAETLKNLAKRVKADGMGRLKVNFVAHSHGGNVVLEAMRHIKDDIDVGRVVLLGTPLIGARPALRCVRILFSYSLLVFIALVLAMATFLAILAVTSGLDSLVLDAEAVADTASIGRETGSNSELATMVTTMAVSSFYVFALGWMLAGVAFLVDLIWRCLWSPVRWLRRRAGGPVYGMSAALLRTRLGDRPAVLLTSYYDEAALLLQLCSAPKKLYVELVERKLKLIMRFVERIFVRPILVGLFLRAIEIALERAAMGFSRLTLLFFDYEMADLRNGKEYPPSVIRRQDVTEQLRPTVQARRLDMVPNVAAVRTVEPAPGEDRHVSSLRQSMEDVGRNLMGQVQLRHSLYYDNDVITEVVAEILVAE